MTCRSMLFGAFIASGYLPMVHNYLLYGGPGLRYFPMTAALIMNGLDFLGAAFYVSRFPESHFPHRFDIWVCKSCAYNQGREINTCDRVLVTRYFMFWLWLGR
jgi:hypothetical protein